MQLCFATNNANKLTELRQLVGTTINLQSLEDIGCSVDIPETGTTLQANSLQKANYIREQFSIDCFADDTGLEVEVLGGAPGVYSARYAGEPANSFSNVNLLLKNLKGISNRAAQFKTVITLLISGNDPIYFDGIVKGRIAEEVSGESGFGYDPIFIPDGFNCTFAEMTAKEKNRISHRGKAVQKLVNFLINLT